jgi:hypothetical protein
MKSRVIPWAGLDPHLLVSRVREELLTGSPCPSLEGNEERDVPFPVLLEPGVLGRNTEEDFKDACRVSARARAGQMNRCLFLALVVILRDILRINQHPQLGFLR